MRKNTENKILSFETTKNIDNDEVSLNLELFNKGKLLLNYYISFEELQRIKIIQRQREKGYEENRKDL